MGLDMLASDEVSETIKQAECLLDGHKLQMMLLLHEAGLTSGDKGIIASEMLAREAPKLIAWFHLLQTLQKRRDLLNRARLLSGECGIADSPGRPESSTGQQTVSGLNAIDARGVRMEA